MVGQATQSPDIPLCVVIGCSKPILWRRNSLKGLFIPQTILNPIARVANLELSCIFKEENVVGLEVKVAKLLLVERAETMQNIPYHLQCLLGGQKNFFRQQVWEVTRRQREANKNIIIVPTTGLRENSVDKTFSGDFRENFVVIAGSGLFHGYVVISCRVFDHHSICSRFNFIACNISLVVKHKALWERSVPLLEGQLLNLHFWLYNPITPIWFEGSIVGPWKESLIVETSLGRFPGLSGSCVSGILLHGFPGLGVSCGVQHAYAVWKGHSLDLFGFGWNWGSYFQFFKPMASDLLLEFFPFLLQLLQRIKRVRIDDTGGHPPSCLNLANDLIQQHCFEWHRHWKNNYISGWPPLQFEFQVKFLLKKC